jgi:mRNA-degrading endonuclease RelE of RelBE toxin-antitoxin system
VKYLIFIFACNIMKVEFLRLWWLWKSIANNASNSERQRRQKRRLALVDGNISDHGQRTVVHLRRHSSFRKSRHYRLIFAINNLHNFLTIQSVYSRSLRVATKQKAQTWRAFDLFGKTWSVQLEWARCAIKRCEYNTLIEYLGNHSCNDILWAPTFACFLQELIIVN